MNKFSISNLKRLNHSERLNFCENIREYLIKKISKTGGHIGANLATIEVTVAMHFVFKSPIDSFLFDTGHQGYTHKLLTNRKKLFSTLNTNGGMSRFLTKKESKHDLIEASHAGTAISIGSGIAYSKFIQKNKSNTLVLVGDGSLVEGMSFEALNYLYELPKDTFFTLIINDNEMAIDKNIGGLKEILKDKYASRSFFKKMGLDYFFIENGNDVNAIIKFFKLIKNKKNKSVVHIKTTKGLGLDIAKNHPYKMHFSMPFDINNSKSVNPTISGETMSVLVSKFILKNLNYFKKFKLITPGTPYASNLEPIIAKTRNFVHDVGMAEQHSLGYATGLSLYGIKPILFIQSTFLQRAFDQLIHEISYMEIPITIFCVRSGLAGHDSPTHHGIYDLAYLKSIPNLTLYSPGSSNDLIKKLRNKFILKKDKNISEIIFLPYEPIENLTYHKCKNYSSYDLYYKTIKSNNILILTHVNLLKNSLLLAEKIFKIRKIYPNVICIKRLKPINFDKMMIYKSKKIIVLEEYSSINGIYSDLNNFIQKNSLNIKVTEFNLGDGFTQAGDKEYILKSKQLYFNQIFKFLIRNSVID